MIYLDNAATTVMSEVALNALIEISSDIYGNPSSVYGFGRKAKKILEKSRKIIADCIGAEPEEIYFTSCGTESNNWAVKQTTDIIPRAIVSQVEHHAILHPVMQCQKKGCEIKYANVRSDGIVDIEEFKMLLDGSQTFVSVMLQNNETGVIQPIRELARLTHCDNEKSIFHTDAVQAIGHMSINVKELGIDMLSASAHKFNGPKGVGFLYIDKRCAISPLLSGGGQEQGKRSGTENVAGIYSMAKALEDNVKNMENIKLHILNLEELLLERLSHEKIVFNINGNSKHRAIGIINIEIEGIDGEGLMNMLDMHNICISVGSACNSKSKKRSHVLKAMGIDEQKIDSSVRISIGRTNTSEDIIKLVDEIKRYYELSRITAK